MTIIMVKDYYIVFLSTVLHPWRSSGNYMLYQRARNISLFINSHSESPSSHASSPWNTSERNGHLSTLRSTHESSRSSN